MSVTAISEPVAMPAPPPRAARLAPPSLAPSHLFRPRLADRLTFTPSARVALVVAPSGSGKSALVSAWWRQASVTASSSSRPALAWLSLDRADNPRVRSEADVERLVRENQKLVHLVVNRFVKRYPVGAMEPEDLVSWGLIGLMQAARIWDAERGAFATVAYKAIEWMILRGIRREWKPDQAAVTVSLDDLLSDAAGGDGAGERFGERIAADHDVEGELLTGETRAVVRSAVARLPAPERRLIERHFFEEVPVSRLAQEWGVSAQGLYARQRQALRRLRATLATTVTAEAA